ncbi:MAG TPA: universal stress protein [Ktedonobacterales bacterium]|nr:universal stress protein [Ktedonobacterales bacterium]
MQKSEATTPAVDLDAPSARILVPLDGSSRAERALPIALQLATALRLPLTLARVIPPISPLPTALGAPVDPVVYQRLIDDTAAEARRYLERQATEVRKRGIVAETIQPNGDPGVELLALCASEPIALTVMTTHGRTGLARAALGSVADQLVRGATPPVLLIRAAGGDSENAEPLAESSSDVLRRLIIPLDGSTIAEAALSAARPLADALAQTITLLAVIPYTAETSERVAVRQYLAKQAEAFDAQLKAPTGRIEAIMQEGVVPSENILELAADIGGMVVMATHGRGGLRRWALGSVTNEVIHRTQLPVLVVHAMQQPATRQE